MSFYEDRVFPVLMEIGTKGFRSNCEQVISASQGRVLEIGAGTGANLLSYPAAVTHVVGIEPVEAMLGKARARVAGQNLGYEVTLSVGDARALDFPDAHFDTVVACLVFCTIPDPEKAAAEVFRVLKPDGRLVFFEHVESQSKRLGWLQGKLTPAWRKFACGCELNRKSRQLFEKAGFEFEKLNEYKHPKVPSLFAPVIEGAAVKPGMR